MCYVDNDEPSHTLFIYQNLNLVSAIKKLPEATWGSQKNLLHNDRMLVHPH